MTESVESMAPGDAPDLDTAELAGLLSVAPVRVGVHSPVFAADDSIVDFRLVWWNTAFENTRSTPPTYGQSMLDSYIDAIEAVAYGGRAWRGEEVLQEFTVDDAGVLVYSSMTTATTLSVRWFRFHDFIVEIAEDVTELRSAQNRLAESDLELLESWRIQEISEARQQIARDMHDSVIQRLLAVGMGMRYSLGLDGIPDEIRDGTRTVVRNLDDAIHELRSIVDTLADRSPPTRAVGGLDDTILEVVESMVPLLGHRPGLSINVRCDLEEDLTYDMSAVVRESLANVARHASATRSFVHVECQGDVLTIRVLDDGVGFVAGSRRGHGLANLAERAAAWGGSVELGPRSDRSGTRLKWSIPCPLASAD